MGLFIKNTVWTIVTRLLTMGLGLIYSILIARILGPEGKGFYTMAITFIVFLASFTNLGISSAGNYHMAVKKFPPAVIFGNIVIVNAVISVSSLLIGGIFIFFFSSRLLPGVPSFYLWLAMTIIPFYLFNLSFGHAFLGLQRIVIFNVFNLLSSVLYTALIILLLWVLRLGVAGGIFCDLLVYLITVAFMFFIFFRLIKKISFKINFIFIRKMFGYGIKMYLTQILSLLNYRFDIFLINLFMNPLAVGFYSVAVGIAEQLCIVSSSANVVLFPRVAAEKNEYLRREITPMVCRTVLVVTTAMAIIIYFLADRLIPLLYSLKFLPAVSALKVLLLGIPALVVWRVLNNDLSGRGRPELNVYINLAAIALNILLNVILIPKIGIVGASWASVISYGIASAITILVYTKITHNGLSGVLLPRYDDFIFYRNLVFDFFRRKKGQ